MKNKPLGFFNSINDELRLVIPFLKSMIVQELYKDSYYELTIGFINGERVSRKRYYSVVECREINIDQKIGKLHITRNIDGDDDSFYIEGENLKYQIEPSMLDYVLKRLQKAVK